MGFPKYLELNFVVQDPRFNLHTLLCCIGKYPRREWCVHSRPQTLWKIKPTLFLHCCLLAIIKYFTTSSIAPTNSTAMVKLGTIDFINHKNKGVKYSAVKHQLHAHSIVSNAIPRKGKGKKNWIRQKKMKYVIHIVSHRVRDI